MHTAIPLPAPCKRAPWNKSRLIGQKRPLKPKDVWVIRVRLQLQGGKRDLALFNLAIYSKLRGCDLVRLQVDDVCAGGRVRDRVNPGLAVLDHIVRCPAKRAASHDLTGVFASRARCYADL